MDTVTEPEAHTGLCRLLFLSLGCCIPTSVCLVAPVGLVSSTPAASLQPSWLGPSTYRRQSWSLPKPRMCVPPWWTWSPCLEGNSPAPEDPALRCIPTLSSEPGLRVNRPSAKA